MVPHSLPVNVLLVGADLCVRPRNGQLHRIAPAGAGSDDSISAIAASLLRLKWNNGEWKDYWAAHRLNLVA